jgi:hypothetical protein
MRMGTVTGSDDYRIRGRLGTYIVVQVNESAYEIVLQNAESHCRVVGYAPNKRQAEREVKRIDAQK